MKFVTVYPTTRKDLWVRKPSIKNWRKMDELSEALVEANAGRDEGDELPAEAIGAFNALHTFMFEKVYCDAEGNPWSGEDVPDVEDIAVEDLHALYAAGTEAINASYAQEAKKPSGAETGSTPQKSGS